MVVNPSWFCRDFYTASSRPEAGVRLPHYSPMLHNAILAFALAYSQNETHQSLGFRKQFAEKAKVHLDNECQSPTLSTVQALAVLSCYHNGMAEQGMSSFSDSSENCLFLCPC